MRLPVNTRLSPKILIAVLLAVAAIPTAHAQEVDQALQAELIKIAERNKLPGGLAAASIKDGKLQRIAVAGVRKSKEDQKMELGDKLHLGSCTKAMTATMLGMLVDEKKLDWKTTVADVFPDWKIDAGYQQVTLAQLMAHRGGIAKDIPLQYNLQFRAEPDRSTTEQRRELLQQVLSKSPAYPPGSKYVYSNMGYMLAGLMAETVTEQNWEALMQKRLFGPLKMTSAGFGPPKGEQPLSQPWGHRKRLISGYEPNHIDNPRCLGPAGTVHCSIADWAKFAAFHLSEQKDGGLLSELTLAKLHQPLAAGSYAGGWLVEPRPWAQGLALNHGGSNNSWFAMIWVAPEIDQAFLAVTNTGGALRACDEAIVAMLRLNGLLK